MKALVSVGLIFYVSLLAIPSYAQSVHFKIETLDHATDHTSKVILNDNVLTIRHPECANIKSSVRVSPKQHKETMITLECAGKSYQLTESIFMEKATHEEVNLSDLVESK